MQDSMNSRIYDEARERIALSSVGFVNATYDKRADRPCAGSGTLTTVNSAKGILTAAHVVEELSSLPSVGVVRFTGPPKQAMTISIDHIRVISCGNQDWLQEGPDLAFMILPSQDVSALEAFGCVFLDLVSRRVQLAQGNVEGEFYLLAGMVGEMTSSEVVSEGTARVVSGGLVDFVNVGPHVFRGPFDYVDCESVPDAAFLPPESYAGMSGGGLFVVEVETAQDLTKSVSRISPVGVNYWQSSLSEGKRTITCHYVNSVYGVLLDKVLMEAI